MGHARVDLISGPRADAVLLVEQVLPQLFHVGSAGETTAHTDDGDITLLRSTSRSLACLGWRLLFGGRLLGYFCVGGAFRTRLGAGTDAGSMMRGAGRLGEFWAELVMLRA